jgi:hypothetical protein
MRSGALIQDQVETVSKHPFRAVHEEMPFEADEVEARIQHVCDRHTNLNTSSHIVRLKTGTHTYNAELDLCVKVEAVRWMLRIAKHMSDPAREVVLLRIENSLRQLEAAVEPRPYPVEPGARTERFFRPAHA